VLAYVGDGNNVARSLAILGALAGRRGRVAAPPDGYQLEPTRRRDARSPELELTSTRSPTAATASRASTATSCSSPARVPGDRVRAVVGKAQARLRRGARGRGPRAERRPHRAGRRPPGRAVAGAALRAPARGQGRAGRRRAARIGRLDGFELEPIVPAVEQWRYRNKLEYSFGTGDDGELVCGFHAPGRWNEIVDVTTASARLRARQRRARAGARVVPRAGPGAYDRRDAARLPAQPRRPRGRRTGQLQVRSSPRPGELDVDALIEAVDADGCVDADRGRRRDDPGGETELLGHAAARGGAALGDLRFRISPEAFFQTNTEMAERALRRRRRVRRPARPRARLRPLLRHRHDRPLAGAARGEVWGRDRRAAVADAIENARLNEIDNARFFAGDVRTGDARARRAAGKPDVVVVDPPRAGLSQKVVRRIVEAAPRGSSTSPATRRRSRRTPRSSSRPATSCARAPGRHVPADAAHRVRGAAGGVDLDVLGRRVQAGAPVDDAVAARVDGDEADARAGSRPRRRRGTSRSSRRAGSAGEEARGPGVPSAPTARTLSSVSGCTRADRGGASRA
jgi:23S rRNA (uracil1939-C5)-methyltransferase